MNATPTNKLDARLLGPFRVADGDDRVADISANYRLETLGGVIIDRTVPRDQLVVVIPAVWLSKRQQQLYGSKELVEVADRFKNNEPGPLTVEVGQEQYAIEHPGRKNYEIAKRVFG